MTAVSDVDLRTFRNWYTQAGNASVKVVEESQGSTRTLRIEQACVRTEVVEEANPFVIPILIGIVGSSGVDLLSDTLDRSAIAVETDLTFREGSSSGSLMFELDSKNAQITFRNVPDDAEVSFLRDFSAPVSLGIL